MLKPPHCPHHRQRPQNPNPNPTSPGLAKSTAPSDRDQLKLLETLNIFGLKANYTDKFRDYLQLEGVGAERAVFMLSVRKQFGETKNLKILQKCDSACKFEYLGKPIDLPNKPDKRDYVTLKCHEHLQIPELFEL